jgi:8-oxo-dGTP pyrophosphatase MutT (NUDIX family)/phosphohistidine phosphatase SixA
VARRDQPPAVRAAGGVVWQVRKRKVEIAVVHRPRYDDWSLPKGKVRDGETALAAAVREVGEEIGAQVVVSRRMTEVTYDVAAGRKSLTYWVMRHVAGSFAAGDEVDELRWLRPKAARELLSYPVDRRVVADFAAVPIPDSVLLLVRHAKAGKRSDWRGADLDRPLEPAGIEQAARLADLLVPFAPDRLVSAEPLRCVQTLQPIAGRLGLDVRVDPVFGDASYARAPGASENALLALGKPGRVTAVCSQGETIPGLIDRLSRGTRDGETKKGAAWALSVVDGTVVSMDRYDDAVRTAD